MPGTKYQLRYTCACSLRASRAYYDHPIRSVIPSRRFSEHSPRRRIQHDEGRADTVEALSKELPKSSNISNSASQHHGEQEQGAMSRRLAEATEDALLEGGRAGRKAVEEAGFSDELKQKLLERVEAAKFRSENAAAFVEAEMPSNVGQGSRDIAMGQAWTGSESTGDAVLRMLDDARKPLAPGLRGPAKIPSPVVDLRFKKAPKQKPGQRLANARDKTSMYVISKDTNMTDKEREDMRRELKERFLPGARAMPSSVQGLQALANERIEDAIARGQFKNIPRGKAIERDARADNPFIDTTEYIMNKMIQRQDIVPPWIEKQQEVVKAANVFRGRLRNDWKRHAARTISSRGGSLQEQMRIAELYAEAEKVHNPKRQSVVQTPVPVLTKVDQEGPPGQQVGISGSPTSPASAGLSEQTPVPLPAPFRIPAWEEAEQSYLQLAVANLNSLTRSYNLMAPELAKKPYFSVERELRSCYADVAPQLAQAIKERAARPAKELVEKIGHRPGSVLERFSTDSVTVHDSKKPLYGFKEFWNELWGERRG